MALQRPNSKTAGVSPTTGLSAHHNKDHASRVPREERLQGQRGLRGHALGEDERKKRECAHTQKE